MVPAHGSDLVEAHALVEADEDHQRVIDAQLVPLLGDRFGDGVGLLLRQRPGLSGPLVGRSAAAWDLVLGVGVQPALGDGVIADHADEAEYLLARRAGAALALHLGEQPLDVAAGDGG